MPLLHFPLALSFSTLEPIAWFLSTAPIFILTLQQPPGSRWSMLPLNVLPAIQSYRTADRLSEALPCLDWLLAFTSLIYIFHATSALYIEEWALPENINAQESAGEQFLGGYAAIRVCFRAWMNPRRLRLTPDVQRISELSKEAITRESKVQYAKAPHRSALIRRVSFFAKRIASLAVLGVLYVTIEIGIIVTLQPGPRDFGPHSQTYLPQVSLKQSTPAFPGGERLGLPFDPPPSGTLTRRVAALRSVYALHWAWLTFFILTVAHSALAVVFVCMVGIDEPEEWPPLFGSPLEAFTIRRFWGCFWHQLGTASMLSYGRVFTRKLLPLHRGSGLEKALLAAWVFGASAAVHALVTRKTEPPDQRMTIGASSDETSGSLDAPLWSSDGWFLMLNFCAGLAEIWASKLLRCRRTPLPESANGYGKPPNPNKRSATNVVLYMLGCLWVFAFFWCVVPPYQYPVLQKVARQSAPFRVDLT